ncbi:glycosyltransferase family 4 protein [Lacicoccus alkaliphilus]|uniref:Glycosyltransferase involved in cell wall bisynthesis n=1 Tax=Lacicoccus alkaliphilus DSM 16010 TaxID=1123231 RepID=A0A1M7FWP9_9BACL|nr:glycosyltransferase family 4 protein [Salinicoccus alkaliphilus]SHM08069.1 Glycosyltransferase involved in cell wall bisynthesis [Salinicoccus alkaliphilus DSM 16010]
MRSEKKILMCSVIAEAIYKSRHELIEEFLKLNYTVIMVSPDSTSEIPKELLTHDKIKYYQIDLKRTGLNPINDLKTINQLRKIIKKEKPSTTYAFGGAKAAIYLTLAAHKEKVRKNYCMINGLGSIYRGSGFKNSIIKSVMTVLFKKSLSKSHGVLFQNNDDLRTLTAKDIVDERKTHIVNGSGVNVEKFPHSPPENTHNFLFVGRLLKDKGIYEYVEAAKLIKQEYQYAKFTIVGGYDDNPTSVNEEEIDEWAKAGIIEYMGRQKDVFPFYKEAAVFVLPSYHEGTPRTSLEAMAVGRPIITTDAPGCRETVIDNKNGFLVPIQNVETLKEKMVFFLQNAEKVKDMGDESHRIALEKFDVNKVNKQILGIITKSRMREV